MYTMGLLVGANNVIIVAIEYMNEEP